MNDIKLTDVWKDDDNSENILQLTYYNPHYATTEKHVKMFDLPVKYKTKKFLAQVELLAYELDDTFEIVEQDAFKKLLVLGSYDGLSGNRYYISEKGLFKIPNDNTRIG
jgi:hypothetical protein